MGDNNPYNYQKGPPQYTQNMMQNMNPHHHLMGPQQYTYFAPQMQPGLQQPKMYVPMFQNQEKQHMYMNQAPQQQEEPKQEDESIEQFISKNSPSGNVIKDIMERAVSVKLDIQSDAVELSSKLASLFVVNLIERAREIQGDKEPINPYSVMMAYYNMDEEGKIPGKVEGTKRSFIK